MRKNASDDYESRERALDPHRAEEQRAAAREIATRLRDRGIEVGDGEDSDQLATLFEAVERFEAIVESHGGDLMMDDLKSSEPDDPHFVLPRRHPGEPLPAYAVRVEAATDQLRHHPPNPDSGA